MLVIENANQQQQRMRARKALDKGGLKAFQKKKEDEEDEFHIVKYEVKSAEQAAELDRMIAEIEVMQEDLGTEHPMTLELINEYSELNYTTREFIDAEEWFRKLWEGRQRAQIKYEIALKDEQGPASHLHGYLAETVTIYDIRIFKCQYRLAKTCEELLRFKEAEELYKGALEGLEHVLQTKHHAEIIPCVDGYAITLHQLGEARYAESLEMYRRLLDLHRKYIGDLDPTTLVVINRMALVLRDMKLLREAEEICVASLDNCTKVMGKDHPITQQCVEIVAFIRHSQGMSEEAEDMFRLSLACNERLLGKGHPTTLRTVVKIAVLLSDQKIWDESEEMHRRALGGFENYYGNDHPETIDEAQYLGELLLRAEEIPEAELMLRRALAGRRRLFTGAAHPKTMDSAHCLAVLIQKQTKWKHDPAITRRVKEAEELYKEALIGRDAALGPDHEDSIETARCLATFLFEEDRVLEAENLCKRVVESRKSKFGVKHLQTAKAAYALGIILQQSRKFYRGIEAFRTAIVGFEHEYEPDKERKDKERNQRKAVKEGERKQRAKEMLAKLREAEGKNGEEKDEGKLSHAEEEYLDELGLGEFSDDDSDDEDTHPTLADCRASYENCLKMNAIG